MQFNVTNGPVSTWERYRDAFRQRAERPASYPHRDRPPPVDLRRLRRDHGRGRVPAPATRAPAWRSTAPPGRRPTTTTATTLVRRRLRQRRSSRARSVDPRRLLRATARRTPRCVASLEAAYGGYARAQLEAEARAERKREREKRRKHAERCGASASPTSAASAASAWRRSATSRAVRRAAERRREARERRRRPRASPRSRLRRRPRRRRRRPPPRRRRRPRPRRPPRRPRRRRPRPRRRRPGGSLGEVGKQRDPCSGPRARLGSETQEPMATPLEIEEHEPRDGEVRMRLRGELDVGSAERVQERLDAIVREARRLTIDLSGLTFMDSTGVRIVWATAHAAVAGRLRARARPGSRPGPLGLRDVRPDQPPAVRGPLARAMPAPRTRTPFLGIESPPSAPVTVTRSRLQSC